MTETIEDLEKRLEKLKAEKKDVEHKKELKAEIKKLEEERKPKSEFMKVLQRMAKNLVDDDS